MHDFWITQALTLAALRVRRAKRQVEEAEMSLDLGRTELRETERTFIKLLSKAKVEPEFETFLYRVTNLYDSDGNPTFTVNELEHAKEIGFLPEDFHEHDDDPDQ